jgi:hypothetical protein
MKARLVPYWHPKLPFAEQKQVFLTSPTTANLWLAKDGFGEFNANVTVLL